MDNLGQGSLTILHSSSPLLLPMLFTEFIAFIALVLLLCWNLMVFRKGLDAAGFEQLRLRLLVCKRIAIAAMLIVVLQVYNVSVLLFFVISTGVSLEGLSNQFSWQIHPIFFGLLVMLFGMIQYLVLDTIRQYKLSSLVKPL